MRVINQTNLGGAINRKGLKFAWCMGLLCVYEKWVFCCNGFGVQSGWSVHVVPKWRISVSSSSNNNEAGVQEFESHSQRIKNEAYVKGLETTLRGVVNDWITTSNRELQGQAQSILRQIRRNAMEKEQIEPAERLMSRAGMPFETVPPDSSRAAFPRTPVETGNDILNNRRSFAQARQAWESNFAAKSTDVNQSKNTSLEGMAVRSALTSRAQTSVKNKVGNFVDSLNSVDDARSAVKSMNTKPTTNTNNSPSTNTNTITNNSSPFAHLGPQPDDAWNRMFAMLQKFQRDHNHPNVPAKFPAYPKLGQWVAAQRELYRQGELTPRQRDLLNALGFEWQVEDPATMEASAEQLTSELVARAGAGNAFEGEMLGIGGLEDVLKQVKRRIWIPLAAPPSLLKELGINPVRGLLLYGQPGCGKTLLARQLGAILSPARPITVVSGPEIMERFLGASEANLRAVFDNPPAVHSEFCATPEEEEALNKAALHVVVMDELDAMARARGGRKGGGDQGDAGVARDSVVNQLLAKLDGVDPLCVPTLVIGMTNQRDLIEPALLRPGRLEVQIEVPPPRTPEQRVSILRVHTLQMFRAGRLLVSDAPLNSPATKLWQGNQFHEHLESYDELLMKLAEETDNFSGAMLAGVARAAASHALERAVCDFADSGKSVGNGCVVTVEDFELAIEDVLQGNSGKEDVKQEDTDQINTGSDLKINNSSNHSTAKL